LLFLPRHSKLVAVVIVVAAKVKKKAKRKLSRSLKFSTILTKKLGNRLPGFLFLNARPERFEITLKVHLERH